MEGVIIIFYCITCIVSALYMLNTGMYGGEAYSVGRVHFSFIEIIVHLLIVVLGYFYIYHFYNRTKDKKTKCKIKYNVKRLDKLYFIFLIISWALFITAGVGSAVEGGKSSLGFIGAILNVRTLFPFYYVLARRKTLFYPLNILLFCGLRLSQGWTGFFWDLMLMEILIRFQYFRFNRIRKGYAIIILFVAAPLMTSGIALDLPKVGGKALNGEETSVNISVDKDGYYYIGQTEVPAEEIVGKLRAIRDTNTELSVTISGDAGAEYGRVIGLMALLKEAGFDKVGLKTEAKPLGKKK